MKTNLEMYFEARIKDLKKEAKYYIDHSDNISYSFACRAIAEKRDQIFEVLSFSHIWKKNIDGIKFNEYKERLAQVYDKACRQIKDKHLSK